MRKAIIICRETTTNNRISIRNGLLDKLWAGVMNDIMDFKRSLIFTGISR